MDLKKTLCLFETTMPIRANLKELDMTQYKFNEEHNIISKLYEQNKENEVFVLHDGPPYANGSIHLGHAYNKIMKDIAIRSHFMMGYNAKTTPGWDCHGLPIEHKVMQEIKTNDAIEIKKACRNYANKWIDDQKKSFKKLGVLMDFDNPYKTMDYEYQSDIVNSFAILVEKGYISRANKTIPWCCGCQTTLATAEIEYQNRKDPSIYVLFPMHTVDIAKITTHKIDMISLVIWTTTPWTLPLNRAIMVKKNTHYILLQYQASYLIIGKDCLDHFSKITNKEYLVIEIFSSLLLSSCTVFHPFEQNTLVPIIADDSVELGEGTACVHTAPGCGPVDYEIGIKNNLEIYSPVSSIGTYTANIKIPELIGMSISDAQGWVITKLQEKNLLWHKGSINHSYPHCWRSKEGLIFRATPQWFCDLEKNNFKDKVIQAVEGINFYPSSSKSFLKSTILNRWEWCISRQRAWGVPIIALINIENDEYWTNACFIRYIASQIKKQGIEYWDQVTLESLIAYLPKDIDIKKWRKETNILDVWFDSGVSHRSVLKKQNQFPADVYLEGVDQHRGWFQSSLLTSLALNDCAPMKSIISCGHTVDEKGQKMSKSIGNVIVPEEIIDLIGLDGLRMWVSSVNLGGDIVVGKKIFNNISEVYRKIRNTCRFGVQNIVDFNPDMDMVNFDELGKVNQAIIKKMFLYQMKCINAYQQYNYPEIFHTIIEICTSFLSSFYFDIIKDILYCDEKNSVERRAVQSTIYIILEVLTKLIAPILINTTEDITNNYLSKKNESIHLDSFCDFSWLQKSSLLKNTIFQLPKNPFKQEAVAALSYKIQCASYQYEKGEVIMEDHIFNAQALIDILLMLRNDVFKIVEKLREENSIKQSIEAKIICTVGKNSKYDSVFNTLEKEFGENFISMLCQILLVSEIVIYKAEYHVDHINLQNCTLCQEACSKQCNSNYTIIAEKHLGEKCQRCWKYFYQTNNEPICKRCINAIK